MNLNIKGKKALVSGSTAGIGFAIAAGLAAEGVAVILNGRSQKRVDDAIAAIRGKFPDVGVSGVAADLSTAAGAEEIRTQVKDVDILVNNTGIFEPKAFLDIPDADWSRFSKRTLWSGVRLTRAFLPSMVKGGWGRVIFISSESGLHIPPEMIHYGVTKTAQIALARGVAESVAGTGVTVNSVLPGPTASEGVNTFFGNVARTQGKTTDEVEKGFFETMRPTSLIQRFAKVEEVAALVVYLSGDIASATTGAALRVDGGVVRAIP